MNRRALNLLLPALAGALFVGVWYGVHAWLSEDSRFLLPTPGDIALAFRDHAGEPSLSEPICSHQKCSRTISLYYS